MDGGQPEDRVRPQQDRQREYCARADHGKREQHETDGETGSRDMSPRSGRKTVDEAFRVSEGDRQAHAGIGGEEKSMLAAARESTRGEEQDGAIERAGENPRRREPGEAGSGVGTVGGGDVGLL